MHKITNEDLKLTFDKVKREVKRVKSGYIKVFLSTMLNFGAICANAQDSIVKKQTVDMATGMRSNGKIYVVVAVLCIILAGLFIYLVNLDKKVGRLEKGMDINHS